MGTGRTLNYREASGVGNYVRIKLIRTDDGEKFRAYTNPFGLATP